MAMIHARNSGTSVRVGTLTSLILAIYLLTGCVPRMPPEYKWFFDLSPAQQHAEMKKLPIDKQVDYYLIGMSYVHPPRMGLAEDIAEQGKDALPYLMRRLREERDDGNRENIIYVFKEMSFFHHDLRGEKEVLRVLSETIASMKEPWKQRAQENLNEILENRVADPAEKLKTIR